MTRSTLAFFLATVFLGSVYFVLNREIRSIGDYRSSDALTIGFVFILMFAVLRLGFHLEDHLAEQQRNVDRYAQANADAMRALRELKAYLEIFQVREDNNGIQLQRREGSGGTLFYRGGEEEKEPIRQLINQLRAYFIDPNIWDETKEQIETVFREQNLFLSASARRDTVFQV